MNDNDTPSNHEGRDERPSRLRGALRRSSCFEEGNMLISAKTLRKQADAIKQAKDEERYNRICDLADRIAKRVREMVEDEIKQAAANGNRKAGVNCIGCYEGSSEMHGKIAEAYKEITGMKLFCWGLPSLLRGKQSKKPEWQYVEDVWVYSVNSLLNDLDENGYEYEVYPRGGCKPVPVTEDNLVDKFLVISW